MTNIYFNSTRSALYFVLNLLKSKFDDKKILIPSYTCHTVLDIVKKLKINYEFYEISNNFTLDLFEFEKKLRSYNFFAFIGTNYFGFPFYNLEFVQLADKYKIIYLEDNSHGLGSIYNGKNLGSFGNFGFTSITKHLRVQSGGVLHDNYNNKLINSTKQIKSEYIKLSKVINFYFEKTFPNLIKQIRLFFAKNIQLDNPYLYKDFNFSISLIDTFSMYVLKNLNLDKLRNKKITNFRYWQNDLQTKFGIQPLLQIDSSTNPWCIPYIIKEDYKNEIIEYLKKRKVIFYTWPSLPNEVIENNNHALKLWKKLLCISTYYN